MILRLTVMLLFMVMLPLNAGSITIYLIPSVTVAEDRPLIMKDVVRIDATAAEVKRISDMKVPMDISRDGFVDRAEVRKLLGNVRVYGSSTRIFRNRQSKHMVSGDDVISPGDQVYIQAARGGVQVELKGEALQKGKTGSTIKVKVKSGKTIRTRVEGPGKVRVEL